MAQLMAHHLVYGLVSDGWEDTRDTVIEIASKLYRRQYFLGSQNEFTPNDIIRRDWNASVKNIMAMKKDCVRYAMN